MRAGGRLITRSLTGHERSLEAAPSLSGKRTVHKPLTLINLPSAQRSWSCDRTYGLIAQALYPQGNQNKGGSMGTAVKEPKRRGRKPSYAAKLLELIAMRHVPQALHVAAVLGIADLIAKQAKSSAELAQVTGTHAASLHRTLRTLVAAGVLSRDEKDRFRLTALGQPLRSDVSNSVRAFIFLTGESELEGRLLDCVRTGKTAIELAAGVTNWIEYYQRDPARAAVFNSAMTALSNAHYAGGVESYDFRSVLKLVDVGGGHGRLLSMILTAYPRCTAYCSNYPTPPKARGRLSAQRG